MIRKLSSEELIDELAEALRDSDGELLAQVANQVLVPQVTYIGDSLFMQEVSEDEEE